MPSRYCTTDARRTNLARELGFALVVLVLIAGSGCRMLATKVRTRVENLVRSGRYVAAEGEIRRWLKLAPHDTAILALDIRLMANERKLNEAILAYQRYHATVRTHSRELLMDIVIAGIKDQDERVSMQALRACGAFDLVEAYQDVVEATRSRRPWIRGEAYLALGRSSNPDATSVLFDGFWDDEWRVRADALEAAGERHDAKSLGGSRICALDPDDEVEWREAVERTELGDLTELHWIEQGLKEGDVYAADAAACLVEIGRQEYLPALDHLLSSDEPMARYLAVKNLGELKAREYLSDIIALSRDTCNRVREGAADGLGRMGDTSALATLAELARDPDYDTRAAAAISIARLRTSETESRLMRLLSDTCNVVRISAIGSLAGLQPPPPSSKSDSLP
jgi:HEAT repeat protein